MCIHVESKIHGVTGKVYKEKQKMNFQKIDEILHGEEMAAKFDEETRLEFAISLAIDDLREIVKMFPNNETWYIYDAVIEALMSLNNEDCRKETELYKKAYKKIVEKVEEYRKNVQNSENYWRKGRKRRNDDENANTRKEVGKNDTRKKNQKSGSKA